jgi:ankyrin repeat protein
MSTKVIVERPMARIRRMLSVGCVALAFLWAAKATADPGEDLIAAATRGDDAAVQALLAKGAEVDAKDNGGMTPLMWASEEGHLDVVQALITNGADINAKTFENGMTPLMWASEEGHLDVAQALITKGADVNAKTIEKGDTALTLAKDADTRALLVRAGAKQ